MGSKEYQRGQRTDQLNLLNLNNREKIIFLKKTEISGAFRSVTKYPTFISLDSQKERRKRVGGPERIFKEIVAEHFPNLVNYTHLQIQGAETIPNRKKKKQRNTHQDTL